MADTLATLIRLRRLETDAATRFLAASLAAERAALAVRDAAAQAVADAALSPLLDPAHPLAAAARAWSPHGTAAVQEADAAVQRHAAAVAEARSALAARRGAAEAAETVQARLVAAARVVEGRKEQARIEEGWGFAPNPTGA